MNSEKAFGMTSHTTENEGYTERQFVRAYWWGMYRYAVTVDCIGTERHSIIGKRERWCGFS